MSEKVSQALIKMLNEITNIETILSKVNAAIFIKKSENMMKEKISYLYNLLQMEASSFNQKPDKEFNLVDSIINTYRKKLNIVYDELYLQYVNIQNEIGDARLKQKAAMINYQKVVNDQELNSKDYNNLKLKIKNKNDVYEKIIKKCEEQFKKCIDDFESQIDNNFYIESNLKIIDENRIFTKLKNIIVNFFVGSSLYKETLDKYQAKVDNIDTEKIVENFRNETIEFITDILEIKEIELEEAV